MSESGGTTELGRRMAKGAAWTVAMRLIVRLQGVISIAVLARLLHPDDYGLIALATVLAASIELLSSFDFDVWLIRHSDARREHYDTVWTLSVIRGAVTCALLLLAAAPVSAYFAEPRLESVLNVLALVTFAAAMANVGVIDFQKHLEFNKDFLYVAGSKLSGVVISIVLAFVLRNYWALVGGLAASHLSRLVLSYWMHDYRPRLTLSAWREAFDFSKWLLAGNLLGFVYRRADTFILGKLVSSQSLGVYTLAFEIANLASTEIVAPIRRVMLPGYSKMLDDLPRLRAAFVNGFALIMLLSAPLAVGVGLVADPLVRVLLGDKWLDAIPLMRVLVLYGVASIGLANQAPVLAALGHTRLMSTLLAAGVAILLPAVIWATHAYGALGAAYAVGVANFLLFAAGLVATLRVLEISLLEPLRQTWRVALATLAMAAVVLALQSALAEAGSPALVVLLACVVSGALVYAAVVLGLWRLGGCADGAERTTIDYLRRARQSP